MDGSLRVGKARQDLLVVRAPKADQELIGGLVERVGLALRTSHEIRTAGQLPHVYQPANGFGQVVGVGLLRLDVLDGLLVRAELRADAAAEVTVGRKLRFFSMRKVPFGVFQCIAVSLRAVTSVTSGKSIA